MFQKTKNESKGQALVEFALVIGVLLLIVFVIIEGGRLFQAWVTVTNAARSAGRYAVTGQYDQTGNFETPECPAGTPVNRWRVCSVKEQAYLASEGLNIDTGAGPTQPRAFGTQICVPGNCPPEGTGPPGEPTRVTVFYNAELITPFLRPFAKFVRVIGQVEVVTAQYDQVSPGDIVIADVGGGATGPSVPNEADLAISKTGDSVANAMDPTHYTLVVSNLGDFGTPTVEIVDFLPDRTISMTNYTVTSGGVAIDFATCSFSEPDQQIACTIPYLDYDAENGIPGTAQIDLELLIAPPAMEVAPYPETVVVTNTATVFNQIATIDPNDTNNVSTATTTISRWYELDINKTILPTETAVFNLGDTVEYLITVENLGHSSSVSAVLTDTLPPELEFVSWVADTANIPDIDEACKDSALPFITCDLPSLLEGETAGIRILAEITQDLEDLDDITNPAKVTWQNPYGFASDSVEFDPTSPLLAVVKSFGSSSIIYADDQASYTIEITNNGDGDATQVVLTDTLVAGNGVAYEYDLPGDFAPCAQQANNIICQGFDIPAGETWLVEVPFIPDLAERQDSGDLTNYLNISSNGGYYDVPEVSVSTKVVPLFDLSVNKEEDLNRLATEDYVFYTVEVDNAGPSTSLPFTIEDDLTVESNDGTAVTATIVSASTKVVGCSDIDTSASPTFRCTIDPIDPGETASFTLRVDLAGFNGTIWNRASVEDNYAPDGGTNDSDSTDPLTYPALAITKSGPEVLDVGEEGEYVVTVINQGRSEFSFSISDVVKTDPEKLIGPVTVAATNASCPADDGSSGSFECTLTLGIDESATITAIITPLAGGYLTNTATISAPDNVPGDYSAGAVVNTSILMADLGITLTQTSAVSETFTYKIDVINDGPDPAAAPVITGTIEIVSGTLLTITVSENPGLTGSCFTDDNTAGLSTPVEFSCPSLSPSGLATGDTQILYVELVFGDETGNEFSISAEVKSETYDPGPLPNIDSLDWPQP